MTTSKPGLSAVARGVHAKKIRICVDCGPAPKGKKNRDAPFPGPRCATHHREHKKARNQSNADKRLEQKYSITRAEYDQIKAEQEGYCPCGEWTGYNGASRALSVDHDHVTGYVRGLLCKHCNDLLGRVHDDPRYFEKMASYLRNPPAFRVIGKRVAEGAPRQGRCAGLTSYSAGYGGVADCGDTEPHLPHYVPPGQTAC